MNDLTVFPRPRRVEQQGPGAPSDTEPTMVVDSDTRSEGYRLTIADGAVELRHGDEAGLRYGLSTLDQLRARSPRELPGLDITDWPDTPVRSYMLDISRNRVPTMETLAWLVDVLAACRINQLQLYTEHTFAFTDHETVWRDASPMTAAEMRDLDRRCAERGIELVPCLNVFGHMGPWLAHDRYRDRAECPAGFDIPVLETHLDPLTLEPTRENAEFALALIHELTATVSSRRVNICCDETLELGRGRSEALVAARGKGSVFVDHLLRIVEPLVGEGRDVLFWADMFRSDPELLRRLPESGATAIAWQYDPPGEEGSGLSFLAMIPELVDLFGFPPDMHLGFESQTRQLSEADFPFWVAPGTGSWNSLIGRWPHARANILDAVDVGLASGAAGVVLTDWGDNGHMQPLSISAVPVAFAAAVSWCADTNRDTAIDADIDTVIFGSGTAGLAAVVAELGSLSDRLDRTGINGSPIFYDLLLSPPLPVSGEVSPEAAASLEDALEAATVAVGASAPKGPQSAEIIQELDAAIRLARHGAWRMSRLAGRDDRSDADMRTDLAEAMEAQRAAWLARSRPGGLEVSLGLLEPTLESYDP